MANNAKTGAEATRQSLPRVDPDRDWSDPIDDDPRTLHHMLRQSVERYGDSPLFGVISDPGQPRTHLSYSQFSELSDAVSRALAARGVETGMRVAMIMDNSTQWAAIAFAANRLGAVYTAMYTHQSGADWAYILADAEPHVVVIQSAALLERLVEHMPDDGATWPAHMITLDDASPTSSPPDGVSVETWSDVVAEGRATEDDITAADDPHALGLLIYTSGTTGHPKGVMLSNWNLLSNILSVRGRYPLYPGDRTAAFLPWAHSFGAIGDLYWMILSGLHINLISDLTRIADECAEIKPHALLAVPRVWNKFYTRVSWTLQSSFIKRLLGGKAMKLATARTDAAGVHGVAVPPTGWLDRKLDRIVFGKVRARFGGELRFCLSAGAALSPDVARFLQRCGFSVFEGYGLSETSPIVALNAWDELENTRTGSVGRPVPGVRVEIDTSVWDDPEAPNEGEIVIHGPNIMQGYWKKEAETAAVIGEDGGFRSGDLGHLDADGYLWITGRLKEQFKILNGKYVAPSPLEELMNLHPLVEQSLLDGSGREHTFAIIHPDPDAVRESLAAAGLSSSGSMSELCVRNEVSEHISGVLKDQTFTGAGWKPFERPRYIILDPVEWTPDNGLLTPSFKARRQQLLKRHGEAIAALK